jgi:N-dimethylarginine dimethylaminohydrolase
MSTGARMERSLKPPLFTRPTFLMCPPRFFDVQYVINPWMEGNLHGPSYALALEQWNCLHAAVGELADVLLMEPRPGLPDMVFTANAGLVRDGVVALSRFVHRERQGEEKHFRSWFEVEGFRVREVPPGASFEGEGDALFTPDGARLWVGHGWRTDIASHAHLHELWSCEVVSLRLVDPCFYHLDTCFCPLANGDVLYYPPAFDDVSRAQIEAFYPEDRRVIVEQGDALQFACNAVNIGRTLILNEISPRLRDALQLRGLHVIQVRLSEFLKAGGAAKCLVLRLSELHATHRQG